MLAYRYRPTAGTERKAGQAVDGLIATQTPDGYIGNYADQAHLEAWDIWGRKYCMRVYWPGMTYGSDRALQSARREADY